VKILKNDGRGEVTVFRGDRLGNLIRDLNFKGVIISHLRKTHHIHVNVFRDSPVDLEMLASANKAIVVHDSDNTNSHSMDEMLRDRSSTGFVRGQRQVLLLLNKKPSMRLDSMLLPVVPLVNDPEFLKSFFGPGLELNFLDATAEEAGNLSSNPTRDASSSGSVLRNEHSRSAAISHWITSPKC
jgi:hypothetical protein